ncbi:hypothetical protein [Salinicoccus sp. CNSTN-B1]
MTNENKKAWLNLALPIIYTCVLFFVPEIMDDFVKFIITLFIVIIIQFYFTKFLNKKFPSSDDLKD